MNDSENYENSFASLFVYNNHLLATEISVLNSVQVCNDLRTAMVLFKPWLYWFIRTEVVGKKVQLLVRKSCWEVS
jgi:hypothetical protein